MRPFWSCTVPSARISEISAFPARSPPSCTRFAIRRYSASLIPARKRIGSTFETVVSSVLSLRPTRLPALTFVVPTIPSRGAAIEQ